MSRALKLAALYLERERLAKAIDDLENEQPIEGRPLPDNKSHTNRIVIRSESDPSKEYIVAQGNHGGWECSCPSWIYRRKCKHLRQAGLA